MTSLRWFLLGVVSFGVIVVLAAALFLLNAHGFSAREQPTALEAWIARAFRSAALPSDARARNNPVANSPEALADARAHWADHCAICHANDGSGDTQLGKHTYPPAPDIRLPATQQMSDGELFYIIQNGIRLSAMPAWGSASDHDAEDSWKLVHSGVSRAANRSRLAAGPVSAPRSSAHVTKATRCGLENCAYVAEKHSPVGADTV